MASIIILVILLAVYAVLTIMSLRNSGDRRYSAASSFALAALWLGLLVTGIVQKTASGAWFWMLLVLEALLIVLNVMSGFITLKKK